MKQLLYILIPGVLVLASCKKGSPGATRLMVQNATSDVSALSVIWNNNSIGAGTLAQGQATGLATPSYLQLPAGTNNVVLKSGGSPFLNKNVYTGANTYYSLLVYDSSAVANTPGVVLLTDDLSVQDTTNFNYVSSYRFINCVPDTAVDLLLINNADTSFNTYGFIGANAYGPNLQIFQTIPYGVYKLYIFRSGSDSTGMATPILASPDSINFGLQQHLSLIYSGKPGGTGAAAIKLTVINHIAH